MRIITLAILLLLLLAPGLQMQFKFLPEKHLSGKTFKAGLPELELSWILKGEYQSKVETWLKTKLGFRGKLVRTDNQLNYWLFGLMSSRSHTPLILGEDDFLFEKSYIDFYNRLSPAKEGVLEVVAANLAELKGLLAKKGIPLLIVISPSKAEVYPEKLPKKHLRADRAVSYTHLTLPTICSV